jgi:hypothetical protein
MVEPHCGSSATYAVIPAARTFVSGTPEYDPALTLALFGVKSMDSARKRAVAELPFCRECPGWCQFEVTSREGPA